jgi:hypothetical protein
MSVKDKSYLVQALKYWREDMPIETGRLIFENLPPLQRSKWAARILRAVIAKSGVKSPAIERILDIANRPDDWKKAHDAFSSARRATFELTDLKAITAEQKLLLYNLALAELVAKVIYNSTEPRDKFDDDSGWWIAVLLKKNLELIKDESFSKSMWSTLCFNEEA